MFESVEETLSVIHVFTVCFYSRLKRQEEAGPTEAGADNAIADGDGETEAGADEEAPDPGPDADPDPESSSKLSMCGSVCSSPGSC